MVAARPVAEAAAAGVELDDARRPRSRDPDRVRELARRRRRPPGRRQVRPADPRALDARASSSTSRPASASRGRSSSAGRAGAPDRALLVADRHRARRRRRGDRRSRSSSRRVPAGPTPASRSSPGTLEVTPRARARSSTVSSLQELPATTVAFQHRTRRHRRGRDAPLGARPARFAPRPQPRRQPPRGRPQLGRAGRDRLRRRGPAVRPDLLHPPRRARHDRQPAVEGRPAGPGPVVHEGDDRHRPERGRDRQLPRRVRDEPVEGDPLGRHPEPRDRPAGLPPGRARELGRPDRRDASCSTSRAAASRPTRRASSSSSASSSRSSRASRWPTRRIGCATLLEAKWDAGDRRAGPTPPRETDRPARRSTRSPRAR